MDSDARRLSADELELLNRLLRRYCQFDLDQFEHWIVSTTYGDVFIDLGRQRPPEGTLEWYTRLPG
jgi:hypothetical protein